MFNVSRKEDMFKFKSLFLNVVAVLSVSMLLADIAIAAAPETRSCGQRRVCRPRKKRRCCCRVIRGERGEQGPQGEQGEPGQSGSCDCNVTTGCPNGLNLIVGNIDVTQDGEQFSLVGFNANVDVAAGEVTITFVDPCQTNVPRTVVATGQQASAATAVSIVSQDAGAGVVVIRFSDDTERVHFVAACCGVTPIP